MGRRNTSFYDDLFLEKTKAIFCKVIENLNVHKEIDYVEALSSRETIERWNDGTHEDSSSSTKPKWPVTFEQFVEHLNGQDQFVQDVAEILVSETIRTAIDKSLNDMAFAVYERGAGPPLLRTDIGCMRDDQHSRRVRLGIERLTRANRRSNTILEEDDMSDSSSETDSSALDPEDFLPIGTVPRAPPSVLPARPRARPRPDLLERLGTASEMTRAEAEQAIAELSMEDDRLSEANRQSRLNPYRVDSPSGSRIDTEQAIRAPPIPPLSSSQSDASTGTLVHRFLTEPLPASEGRTSSSAQRDDNHPLTSLSSIYRSTSDALLRPALLDHVAGDADEDESNGSRREEFEAFASSRRHHRQAQVDYDRVRDRLAEAQLSATNNEGETARESETFYRALGTLFRADETIRLVSQEAEEMDPGATTRRSARRISLPSLSSGRRPVLRMPSRLSRQMRQDEYTS